ncbi:hypothetical protein E5F05_03435 (plasmid) [Deinococcus metallilatus]|uniref:Acid phosphatase n=2 Tax=Deinococcus metallilatus TaxID=1211322 RepID=A0AAJ5JZE9_9DEIO|nr:hypothetical protein E5F05_03435 [Deinococcus metallilatus]TLK31930.1 hypothetical protein FCS05_00200 [Deinococcus metallilatus]GMA17166.1 hypothetical protein GCM10025871_34970 [Deinococcus metallilatus]
MITLLRKMLLMLLPLSLTAGGTVLSEGVPTLRPFSHLFVIVLENHSYSTVIGNSNLPTLNGLASQYGLATNFTGVTHPSLPNYVAMLMGSTFGSHSDDPGQRFAGDHLALQLERAGRSWRGYFQGLPELGWDGPYAGLYAKKHNPFMLAADIASNPQRSANVVPLDRLSDDLRAGKAPDFALIVPDVCHDMHGAPECPVKATLDRDGDAFVRTWTDKIMSSAAWQGNAAVVITFDEGNVEGKGGNDEATGGGRIATIVVTREGPRAAKSNAPYNHYALLRTFEDAWGLPPLREAAQAKPMTDLFVR